MKHGVEIRYCTKCRWMLRSTWMAQEILSTFEDEVTEVALLPGTNAAFEIRVDDELIWSRERDGGFPEITLLKSLVRDIVAPTRKLGHIDAKLERAKTSSNP